MKSFTEAAIEICEKQGHSHTEVWGARKKFIALEVILAIITTQNIEEAATLLNISRNTLKTIIAKNLTSNGKTNTAFSWDLYLLSLIDYKVCTKCLELKPFSMFNKDKSKSLGITASCKSCDYIRSKEYREQHREEYLEYLKKYRIKHSAEYSERTKTYKLTKEKRVPSWANREKIKDIYKNRPEGCHVDHIIPLNGKLVSGLHVPENLQYLTAEDNIAKSNRFEIGV